MSNIDNGRGYVSPDVQDILDRKPNIQQQTSQLKARTVLNRDILPVAFTRQKTVNVYAGQELDLSLDGFNAACLIYRNPTNYWWYVDQCQLFIAPMTAVGAINFSTKPERINIRFLAPVDATQPTITNPNSYATFEFGDIPVPMTSLIIPPSASGSGGNVTVVGPLDGAGGVKVGIDSNVTVVQPTGANLHVDVDTIPNVTVVQGSGANLHVDVDSAPTTTVVQASGANLHVDVDSVPTTTVVQASGANLHVDVDNFPATQATTPPDESPYTLISTASTNANNVKASAGRLKSIHVINNNAAPRYLKIFNKATTPVPGTDTPVLNFEIPANGAGANFGSGFVEDFNVLLSSGIGIAITGGQALLDATAISAGDVTLNMTYV